jgi:uncharacterized protein YndB with AHSA1/START domain
VNRVETSIEIAAPPEEVWEVLMDPHRLADWVTIHRGVSNVSDHPLEGGSTMRQKLCLRGATFKVVWTVSEVDEPRLAVWEGNVPARAHARTQYRLEPNGNGGTHFDYLNEFRPPMGPLGRAAGSVVMGDAPRREADASLRKLKRLLEK